MLLVLPLVILLFVVIVVAVAGVFVALSAGGFTAVSLVALGYWRSWRWAQWIGWGLGIVVCSLSLLLACLTYLLWSRA